MKDIKPVTVKCPMCGGTHLRGIPVWFASANIGVRYTCLRCDWHWTVDAEGNEIK